jgi:import inner membrane translocase subunit TIM16
MSLFRRTTPQLLAIGPFARLIAQLVVPAIAIIAKTLPAAYAAALQNARKSGVADGATEAAMNKGASFLGRARMSKDEALQVLNLNEHDCDVESVQRQYERYFEANSVERGGSFYIQSKVYRAKELLDDYVKEKEREDGTVGK